MKMKWSQVGWRFVVKIFLPTALFVGVSIGPLNAQERPEKPAEEPNPFEIPDGTPAELIDFADYLLQSTSLSNDEDSRLKYRLDKAKTLVTVAETLFDSQADDRQMVDAVEFLLLGLHIQQDLHVQGATKRLEQLPDELQRNGLEKLIRPTKHFLLKSRLRSASTSGPLVLKKLIDDVVTFLSEAPLEVPDVRLALSTGLTVERSGETEIATDCYLKLSEALTAHDDWRFVDLADKMKGATRRLGLLGKEMQVEGVDRDGKAFDPTNYRGKVVLVQFWATWCGPCRAETKNTLKFFTQYHEKGFEVISINVDKERESLEKFMAENNLPWRVLVDHERNKDPKLESMGIRYGAFELPTMIMIGVDGKVFSLDTRGKALGENLEKLLGPIDVEVDPKKEEKTER